MYVEPHKTLYDHTLYVSPGDEIGEEIIRKGIYDRSSIEMLKSILQRIDSPVVFDIGANIGNHAISVSAQCKEIHAFEPDTEIFSILKKNYETNQIDNIIANQVGLSDSTRSSEFFVNLAGNIGASTLDPNNKASKFKKSTVYLTTGDEYIQDHQLKSIDLLKIDVEGHEIPVLNGFQQAIAQFKPIILMEWSAAKTIKEAEDSRLFQQIKDNYSVFVVMSSQNKSLWGSGLSRKTKRLLDKIIHRERWYLLPADLSRPHANVFFVPPEKLSLVADMVYQKC